MNSMLATGYSDNFDGGNQTAWVVVNYGDNSTYLFQNDRYELHTESSNPATAKFLGSYVNTIFTDSIAQTRVQKINPSDNFLSYILLRVTPATMSGYVCGASSDDHVGFGKLAGGVYSPMPKLGHNPDYDSSDFNLKCAVIGNKLFAKVWNSSTTEPLGWQINATDNSYSSGVEGIMLATYPTLNWSNVSAAFDDFNVINKSIVYVDDDWAGNSTNTEVESGKIIGFNAFSTIQAAVNNVSVGGIVNVAAGTYNESISLGRVGHTNCQNLTLLGAKSGVAAGVNKVPGTRGTGESVINGAFQTGHDGSGCNGAIIDGFTINGLSSSQGVLLGSSNNPTLNATVKNNILTCAGGQALTMSQSSNGATVLENDMRSTRAGSSVVFVNPSSGHLIEYNYIHDSGAGIGTSSVGNTQVRYNKFYNISDLQWGEAFGGDTFGTGVIVQYNNFDNVLRAMRNFGGSSNAVDVTNNWWGNQAGPNVCSWNDINHNWLDGFATPADIGEMNCSGAAGNPLVYGNALTPASIMPTYAEFLCEPYPTSWVSVGGVCIVGNNVTGNSSDVETTGIVLTNVTINGTQSNSSQTYSGEQNVSLLSGSTIVLEFPFNFSNASLDLSNINITLGADYIIVNMSGVIQPGFTKTVYFDDNGYDNLCVKDADIVSISEISAACNGASEIDISQCLTAGTYTANGISCTKTGTTLKIENLTHSAVLGTKNAVTSAVTGGGGSTGLVKI